MYGFEIILIAFPKVNGSSVAKLKAISIANGFVTLFYTFTVWICFIVFSPKQVELIPEPVAYLLRSSAYWDYRPNRFTIHPNMDDNSCSFYC